ncbi:MAG: SAM-dependent methyltransferase [Cyanobacteria bacterium QH_10_48_56]|nr:MAG: SAM-dependent methyltransferase [Cyanobacteria bacterium QH_10_48_56]
MSEIRAAVQRLYDTYPFPPEPLLDAPPPGYNWRWNWLAAYNFCTGQKPPKQDIRILDAGCGTGIGTEYLAHLNPEADVVGIDLSEKALGVARERCRRSGANRVAFHQLNLEEVEQLPAQFDLINCVGVLHHLPNPMQGIQSLAAQLAPGGLMHVFVYAELGRWEIRLMQEAIALLQDQEDYREGVKLGRQLFETLPENNRLVKRERERWSLDNQRDECFADMYLHPQEIDFNLETLFELIDASGLEFVGFSNPQFWQLERLLGKAPQLLERAKDLPERDRYRLIERLDPDMAHYEFFLARPPLTQADWSSDKALLAAIPERHPCIEGWPSRSLFNYDYQIVNLSESEFEFIQACDANPARGANVQDILAEVSLDLERVRALLDQQLIILTPA